MKHILLTLFFAVCSIAASAQVATFYGVPVDDTPEHFIYKLRCKGLELEMLTEKYGERIYGVGNYSTPANLMIKYGNDLTYTAMLVVKTLSSDMMYETLDNLLLLMEEDHGEGGYENVNSNGTMALKKTLKNGQATVLVTLPKQSSSLFTISYEVYNIDNSRKALELSK